MNLKKLLLVKNDCYLANRYITPTGIMVHSTGANNPKLSRYVGPDDGDLGVNPNNNHWNMSGVGACVHAFIGKLKDGSIATYQTLPWNMRGWHGASGSKGSVNNTHISFEICEDGLNEINYFNRVYTEAVELCAYLCKEYSIPVKNIICHSEGHKLGIASNHADVMHWFPKHGKSMDTFRQDVLSEVLKLQDKKEYESEVESMTKEELKGFIEDTVRQMGKDSSPSTWAVESVSMAKKMGFSDGSNPQSYATREQVMSMIVRSKEVGETSANSKK